MDQNAPLQAKMDHFGLANAKIQFRIRPFLTEMVVETILAHFGPVHFRQYRGDSLVALRFASRDWCSFV